jgi:hypothetical protein
MKTLGETELLEKPEEYGKATLRWMLVDGF